MLACCIANIIIVKCPFSQNFIVRCVVCGWHCFVAFLVLDEYLVVELLIIRPIVFGFIRMGIIIFVVVILYAFKITARVVVLCILGLIIRPVSILIVGQIIWFEVFTICLHSTNLKRAYNFYAIFFCKRSWLQRSTLRMLLFLLACWYCTNC